jgi:hypothetical protein
MATENLYRVFAHSFIIQTEFCISAFSVTRVAVFVFKLSNTPPPLVATYLESSKDSRENNLAIASQIYVHLPCLEIYLEKFQT